MKSNHKNLNKILSSNWIPFSDLLFKYQSEKFKGKRKITVGFAVCVSQLTSKI